MSAVQHADTSRYPFVSSVVEVVKQGCVGTDGQLECLHRSILFLTDPPSLMRRLGYRA